jgi:hypothetical protein
MLPEHKILLDFINNRFAISDLEKITPEDWATLVSEANCHRVAPLLYSKIKLAEAEFMFPTNVILKLREKYLANAYRNTLLFHQLSELVARLNKKEIPVLLLKGAHLAEFVYKDISLRPMSDLDILVKEEHLSEAVQIAFNAGYQFFSDENPEKEKVGVHYDYGIMPHFKHFHAMMHSETKCMLEIHCFIASEDSSFEISASELWQTAKSATLNGNAVFLLSPENLVIHLCLHSAYDHLFEFGLSALYDILILIEYSGENINWEEVQRRSNRWGAKRCLLLSLYFTKKWLGAKVPDEMFENFTIDKMVHLAEDHIFTTSVIPPIHPHYIQWRTRKGMREKIRYVLSVLIPSRNFMANRYIKPKHSRVLLSSYFFRFFQVFKGIHDIGKAMLQDEHYAPRVKRGDNDFRLRKWLADS